MIFNYFAQNWIEITAVIFAILYLVLAVKQNIFCWIFGILAPSYIFLSCAQQAYTWRHTCRFSMYAWVYMVGHNGEKV